MSISLHYAQCVSIEVMMLCGDRNFPNRNRRRLLTVPQKAIPIKTSFHFLYSLKRNSKNQGFRYCLAWRPPFSQMKWYSVSRINLIHHLHRSDQLSNAYSMVILAFTNIPLRRCQKFRIQAALFAAIRHGILPA